MLDAHVSDGVLTIAAADGGRLLRGSGETLLSDGRILSTLDTQSLVRWEVEVAPEGVIIQLELRNETDAPLHVEQLRPLVVQHGYAGLPLQSLRIQQTGWQSWSRAHPPAPFDPNVLTAAPPIRGPRLPHRRAESQLEPWLTVLEADDAPSLLVGYLAARHQLGTIEIWPEQAGGHTLVAATEVDGAQLEPGATLRSEPLFIAHGETADILDAYARLVAERMQARPSGEVVTGWCSWYQLYTNVSEADVDRNLQTLSRFRDRLPLRLVQLDDGYQHAVGDWLELNDKFPSGMPALVRRVRDHGFVPGVWLAPFLVSERSHTFARHPEWVVRDEAGAPLNAIDNWGSPNFVLDTTHPAALRWIQDVLRTACDEWSFEYLKLDFLYAGAMRGQRYDPRLTSVEAYRLGLEAMRAMAGDRFVLASGAPFLASIGLVDGMRIGSDVAAFWGGEGNADGPSLRNAMRASLARLWMHPRWWSNDPDCVIVRASDTQLSLAEVQAWASVVALSGGMLLVGDDVSRLEPDRFALLQRLLPPSGKAARAFGPLAALLPERLHLRVERPWATWDIVGVANWTDSPAAVWFTPDEFGLDRARRHVFDLWSGEYLGCHSSPLDLGPLAAHGLRLLSVRPVADRPMTVGSTGHLLGDAVDLVDEVWDAARRTLTLTPNAAGPPARAGELVVFDPWGPVRRVPFRIADPRPVVLRFE